MIGPSTSRAMAWTASKSPGLAIGKPASMTSTPSRPSWWAISSFSDAFSEIPGDCSPSRRVVSKICTRSMGLSFLSALVCFSLSSRLSGRHASLPLAGEEEKQGKGREGPHSAANGSSDRLRDQDDLADVGPLGQDQMRFGRLVERHLGGDHRPYDPCVDARSQR